MNICSAAQHHLLASDIVPPPAPKKLGTSESPKHTHSILRSLDKQMGGFNFRLQSRSGDENCCQRSISICLQLRISISNMQATVGVNIKFP